MSNNFQSAGWFIVGVSVIIISIFNDDVDWYLGGLIGFLALGISNIYFRLDK